MISPKISATKRSLKMSNFLWFPLPPFTNVAKSVPEIDSENYKMF